MLTIPCTVCGKQTTEVRHYKGHPGEYCSQCAPPRPAPGFDWTVEEVRGTVIGDMTTRYEFWTLDNKTRIAYTDAGSDDSARHWFANHYPTEFKAGARMRVYE